MPCHVPRDGAVVTQVRMLVIDPTFRILMYVIIIPQVIKEMLKRFCGFGARSETTDRVRDSNSYSLREFGLQVWYLCLLAGLLIACAPP